MPSRINTCQTIHEQSNMAANDVHFKDFGTFFEENVRKNHRKKREKTRYDVISQSTNQRRVFT